MDLIESNCFDGHDGCFFLCHRFAEGYLTYHPSAQSYCYGFVLYDTTPGGAGHVKRLANPALLEKALQLALSYMEHCTCGGEDGNASCYACLRAYGNQKIHDKLKRSYVIEFLREIGITPYKKVFIDTAV